MSILAQISILCVYVCVCVCITFYIDAVTFPCHQNKSRLTEPSRYRREWPATGGKEAPQLRMSCVRAESVPVVHHKAVRATKTRIYYKMLSI